MHQKSPLYFFEIKTSEPVLSPTQGPRNIIAETGFASEKWVKWKTGASVRPKSKHDHEGTHPRIAHVRVPKEKFVSS